MGRQPGHAAGLSAGQLAAQALAIVDQEGLQALTLRKLARWVGVEPMSIYHYFPNKDALLDGVWGEVLSEAALPADEPAVTWQDYIRGLAGELRVVLLRHPNALPIMLGRSARTTASLDVVNSILASLTSKGLPLPVAVDVVNSITAFVMAHTLNEHALAPTAPEAIDPQRHPVLAAVVDQGIGAGAGDDARRFALAIDAFIAGFTPQPSR